MRKRQTNTTSQGPPLLPHSHLEYFSIFIFFAASSRLHLTLCVWVCVRVFLSLVPKTATPSAFPLMSFLLLMSVLFAHARISSMLFVLFNLVFAKNREIVCVPTNFLFVQCARVVVERCFRCSLLPCVCLDHQQRIKMKSIKSLAIAFPYSC